MRLSTIVMGLGLCGLLAGGTGCAQMKKAETQVEAEAKNINTSNLKGDLEAIKKGDLKAVGDEALTTHVKTALSQDPKTKSANFTVAVKGGAVTLTGNGTADSKAQAEKVAKGVPGVSHVDNKITAK